MVKLNIAKPSFITTLMKEISFNTNLQTLFNINIEPLRDAESGNSVHQWQCQGDTG